jgi:hypothetical protein
MAANNGDTIERYLVSSNEAEATALRSSLAREGDSIIIPTLERVPHAMEDAPERSDAFSPIDNARSLVESFGPSAHQALVSGLAHTSASVRALSALFLGLKRVRTAVGVPKLKESFEKDPDGLVKLAAAAALIMSDDTDEMTYQKTMGVLVNWANKVAPGWQSLADNAQDGVANLVMVMVGRSLKAEAPSTRPPDSGMRGPGGSSAAEATGTPDTRGTVAQTMVERLRQLDGLRDQNLITDEEHEAKRKIILDQL